ncbi:CFI-box-CTERM domain-containing protein [Nitrosopumilus sp.]|uniref:CFI-box-CTERM domain-containing protein n=1 Tax=Nitrosopumilus sp. TaxID=2024843 RepID=UPI003D148417
MNLVLSLWVITVVALLIPNTVFGNSTYDASIKIINLSNQYSSSEPIEIQVGVTGSSFNCGDLYITIYSGKDIITQNAFFDQCFEKSEKNLPINDQFSYVINNYGSYDIDATMIAKDLKTISIKGAFTVGMESINDDPEISCGGELELSNGMCYLIPIPFEELSISKQSQIIKDEAYNKFRDEIPRLMQLAIPQSEEEVWEFVGEEKSKRFKETFAGIKDRGISFDSINGIQMSRLSEYEQAVVKDAFIQTTEYMKYKGAELLYKIDALREEIKGDIQETSLPPNEKDSIMNDFNFYANSKRTEVINVIGNEIMMMQSSLSIQESPQKIGSDINLYYNDIARDKASSLDSITNPTSSGGGCLIATATYGTELAPQIQQLREIRDNKLLKSESGTLFMKNFNEFYYSFSPFIADIERENPVFKEMIRIGITPMLYSLSIMSLADSDEEILGYGVSVILLNVGMYFGFPIILVMILRHRLY